MDMMNAIAAASMELSAANLQQSYSLKLTKNVMNDQEAMAQQLLEMLPPTPGKGEFIDTYA